MSATTRMLLSHNCTLPKGQVSTLSRNDFTNVFQTGLDSYVDIQCSLIDSPHWIVEVRFDAEQKSPTDIASLCAKSFGAHRLSEIANETDSYTIMLLGGLKTTPAMGNSPASLQPGEWGVDVVETTSPDQFLIDLNWEAVITSKPPEQIFKVIHVVE